MRNSSVKMRGSLLFNAAAKCLACDLPRMGSLGSRLISTAEQTSVLTKAAILTKSARLFSTLPSSAAVPAVQNSSGFIQSTSSRNTLVGKVSAFMPTHSGLTPPGSFLAPTTPVVTQARGRAQIYYRPSAWKRVNKHCIEKRLRTQGGVEVLWRRFLKKRHSLTPFDRILPGTYNSKVLPDHHLKYNRHLVDREVRQRVQNAIRLKHK